MSSMLKIVDGNRVFIGTLLVPDGVKNGLKKSDYYPLYFSDSMGPLNWASDHVRNTETVQVKRVLFRDARDPTGLLCATVKGMTIAELEREDGFAFIPKSAAGGR